MAKKNAKHIRMRKDHTMKDKDGKVIMLKRGQVIDHAKSMLSVEQMEALCLADMASDNLTDYHILFRGEFVNNEAYFDGEFVTNNGSLWEFKRDYEGAWDKSKVKVQVGVEYRKGERNA